MNKLIAFFLMLTTILPAYSQSMDTSIPDWVSVLDGNQFITSSRKRKRHRVDTVMYLLDPSNGEARTINKCAKLSIYSHEGCPKIALQFVPFLRRLEERIKRFKRYDLIEQEVLEHLQKNSSIVFVLVSERDGALHDVFLKKSSGSDTLDRKIVSHLRGSFSNNWLGPIKYPSVSSDNCCIVTEFYRDDDHLEVASIAYGQLGGSPNPTRGCPTVK